jgi:hypothetical protein
MIKQKYNNKKIERADGKFDSKKEYTIWLKLKRQQELGLIKDLKRQVPFVLIPAQYEKVQNISKTGKITTKKKLIEQECKYIADFTYTDLATGEKVVADAKGGILTDTFIIKRKLMLYVHNIKIKILK